MTNPLRVGVIGVGKMGADHADRVTSSLGGAVLAAVADPDTTTAEQLATAYGVRAFADPLALIADEDVDAVIIASPGFVHEEQLLACIDAGKYALCEKPLTMDAESSRRVVEAERAGGTPLIQVGFMRRFDPEYLEMKRHIDDDDFGRLLLVHNVHRNKAVPTDFLSEMAVRDSLVHEVDTVRWLFGQEITEITVHSPAPSSLAHDGMVDPQIAIFKMAGGGMVTNEVFVNCQVGYEVRCEATLEHGSLTVGLGGGTLIRSQNRWGGSIPDDFRVRFADAYDREVQSWVGATRRGEVVGPTAWDGLASTVVCTAGMESLASGRPVSVSLPEVE
ncbi:Gfo/Idh/MocA family protein [Demetria terragena]|uniref:Gfo/Idh/MocA family protein n=1 Tax=Demetria terragena TaxID=63959 RepID=UPI000366A946|nr:Gfo/Idh/MocA family oxidoreductase [Demetria terragena]